MTDSAPATFGIATPPPPPPPSTDIAIQLNAIETNLQLALNALHTLRQELGL